MDYFGITTDLGTAFITINRAKFSRECELDAFYQVIGSPCRTIDAGTPAPYGHRNNEVHMYDKLGIYLLQHHARRTIEAITFVFDLNHANFRPERAFSGSLSIAGQQFNPMLTIREYLHQAPLPFTGSLGWYYYAGNRITIGLATFSRGKTKGGRPSRVRGISAISASFHEEGAGLPPPRQAKKSTEPMDASTRMLEITDRRGRAEI